MAVASSSPVECSRMLARSRNEYLKKKKKKERRARLIHVGASNYRRRAHSAASKRSGNNFLTGVERRASFGECEVNKN